jgi:hypothetical protein
MPKVEANNRSAILLNPVEYIIVYRAFAYDVTAAMLVFQFKRILIKLFCLEHQTWPPWILLSWSLRNECKRSIVNILRTRVVYELMANEVRNTELVTVSTIYEWVE